LKIVGLQYRKNKDEKIYRPFLLIMAFFGLKIALKIGRPLELKLGKEQAHDNKALKWVEIYSQE
jgi:hypothetical protein